MCIVKLPFIHYSTITIIQVKESEFRIHKLLPEQNLPQMISNVHRVMSPKTFTGVFPSALGISFFTSTLACSLKTLTKSWRILKWKVGVSNFLRVFHLSPVLKRQRSFRNKIKHEYKKSNNTNITVVQKTFQDKFIHYYFVYYTE